MKIEIGNWNVETSPQGQYLYIRHKDKPGDIHVKADDEGYVVDVFNDGPAPEVQATLGVTYNDLQED